MFLFDWLVLAIVYPQAYIVQTASGSSLDSDIISAADQSQ